MKILIVDDHTLFREGLRLLLGRLGDDVTIDEAESVTAVLDRATRHAMAPVDLVLLDLNLPGINGLDGIAVLHRQFGGVPVVLLSGVDDPAVVREGLARGARGFICKSVSADALLASVRRALAGEICVPEAPPSCPTTAGGSVRLTPRQLDVLLRLCEGDSNKEIGRRLDMSENTVRSHVAALFQTLGVRTRTEAAAAARRSGLA